MKILSTRFNQLKGMIYHNIDVPTYGKKEVFAIRFVKLKMEILLFVKIHI